MKALIKVENKRILKTGMLLVFLATTLMLSINSSYQAVNSYEIRNINGFVASGEENLTHGKNVGKMDIEKAIVMLRDKKEAIFVDETNVEKLVNLNYPKQDVQTLSNAKINLFFENRLLTIEQMLDESSRFSYTESEKQRFMKEAKKLASLTVEFSEGWKVLNRDIGSFITFVLIIVSIILMPLFADDAQTKMKELVRSTKNGRKRIDFIKIITAFGVGILLYSFAILLFFLIKMLPFGFSGCSEYIQSNENTFFSVFHISYIEQFAWNIIRGYVSLIFVIIMTIMISFIAERIMAGMAIACFYWGLLLIMEQMMSFEVNHLFANFMPLKLVDSTNPFITNEIYRFAGKTFDSIVWCPAVSLILSLLMIGIVFCLIFYKNKKTIKQKQISEK